MPEEEGAEYWRKQGSMQDKETEARMRCGNIGRARKKGYNDWKCRLCDWGDETLEHVLCCAESAKVRDESKKTVARRWVR